MKIDADISAEQDTFDLVRSKDGYAAAGRAMVLLMNNDAFEGLRLGEIGRLIAGQVNRNHYYFICRNNVPTGFIGWAYCSEKAAYDWAERNDPRGIGDGKTGDSVILNSWLADGKDMNSYLLGRLREEWTDKKKLFARRRYTSGKSRALVLNIDRDIKVPGPTT
ncbi:toxin-activating lysine-acyltransferase [Sulfitobacter sp. HNIBRBA2951]|uniref:toxin-activating lysine-acyltransferase n=1 Tax=Sulfitobacter aquimarinus TaxID=3158557 RepID=UPI0032DEA1A4